MKNSTLILNLLFSGMIVFSACNTTHQTTSSKQGETIHPALFATLYQQEAAEYKALCFQAYNIAEQRLAETLKFASAKPRAIVLDIDETVLDNIPYQAEAIKGDFGYPEGWAEWMEQANAEPLAGVVEFLQKAEKDGVAVFYISNRKERFKQATIRNLMEKKLPFADDDHVLLRTASNEKESRRMLIREKYNIIMLVGDNLGDFDGMFEEATADQRTDRVVSNASNFGSKWIVLPNAVYGNWVDVLPGYHQGLPNQELSDSLKVYLRGFRK